MSEPTTADSLNTDLTAGGLSSPSFQGLLWTQWLTSVNDNVFRWFVIGVGKDQFTPENAGLILILGSIFIHVAVHPVCSHRRLAG